jgi:cytochrome c
MSYFVHGAWVVSLSSLLVACGGSSPAEDPAAPPTAAEPGSFAEQVALGGALYGENCGGCHGPSGEGGEAPRLVGLAEGALPLEPRPSAKVRKVRFETVADVAGFVVENMPPDAPGSLESEQYFAILGFALNANGIQLQQKLDAALAPTLTIPR